MGSGRDPRGREEIRLPAPPVRVEATTTGYAASALMRQAAGVPGTVHSAFRRAFNVLLPGGRIVSFSTLDVPAAPNSVVTDLSPEAGWLDLGVGADDRVLMAAEEVRLPASSLRIDLRQAGAFTPRILGGRIPLSDKAPDLLEEAAFRAHRDGPRRGFHALLPFTGRLFDPASPHPSFHDVFCGTGYAEMAKLVRGIVAGDATLIRDSSKGLLGLGRGLTPSGDDALSGLMLGLALTAKALGLLRVALEEVNPLIIAAMDGATGELSRELLHYAARGEGTAVAEGLIVSILSGREDAVVKCTAQLLAMGASSGIDQLWGILIGVRLGLRLSRKAAA